jgi:intein/homing endonuclease
MRIEKLKSINVKLRTKLKELNGLLEKTLEKANMRKIYKQNNNPKNQDVAH